MSSIFFVIDYILCVKNILSSSIGHPTISGGLPALMALSGPPHRDAGHCLLANLVPALCACAIKTLGGDEMRMSQLAEFAGVSVATVSRAFSAPDKVRPELRRRILALADEHGYVYNASAADLSRQVSNTIGLVFPQRIGVTFSQTFMAVQQEMLKHGTSVIVGYAGHDQVIETRKVQQLLERQVSGIIFTGFAVGQEKVIEELAAKGIDSVVTWEKLEDTPFNYVGLDNYRIAHRATEYLIHLGHRNIGLLIGPYDKIRRIGKRFEGYSDALTDNGLEVDESLIVSTELGLPQGRDGMNKLLAGTNRPTAVFAASDYLAIGALKAIREAGLRAPRDISVMGLDDCEFSAYFDPPLTTTRVPAWEIGVLAAKVLLELRRNAGQSPFQHCLDADLIIRDSCAPPPE